LVFTGDDLVLARVDPTTAGGPELLVERRRLDGSIAMPIVASAVHDDARRGLLARASGSGAMLYVMGSDPSGAPGSAAVLLDAVVLDPSGASASPVPPVTTGAIRLVPRGMRARESVLFARSDRFVLGGALAGDVTGADEWVAQAIEIGVDGRALRTAPAANNLERRFDWNRLHRPHGAAPARALRLSPPERFDLACLRLDRFSIGADVIAKGESSQTTTRWSGLHDGFDAGSIGGTGIHVGPHDRDERSGRSRVIIRFSVGAGGGPKRARRSSPSRTVAARYDRLERRTDSYLAPRGEWSVRLQRLDPEGRTSAKSVWETGHPGNVAAARSP
jgi:hypothetical protein